MPSSPSSPASPSSTELRFSLDPERSATLPASWYYDPAIADRERELIWFRSWQFAAYAQQLRAPGEYVALRLLDQPLLIVRSNDGELRAFYNVCRHRGHTLVKDGAGRRSLITCPFHAWTYATDGRLKKAPNGENVPGFRNDDFALAPIRVEQFGLWVFVTLDESLPPLASVAAGLLEDMRRRVPRFDDLVFVRRDHFELRANWKFILDGLECYHCPIIHPQIMGGPDAYVSKSFDTEEHEHWSVHINRGNYEMIEKHRDRLPYDFGDASIRDINIWFLWPNLVFVAHQGPPNIKVLQALPAGPESATRTMHNFCLNDPPTSYDLAQMNNYRDVAWPQDREAMEQQAIGIRARGYHRGRLMVDRERSWQSEHGTHHFQALVWRALGADLAPRG